MYQNKWMLITGTTSGIGEAIVNFFASKGVNIIMTYYGNKEKCDNLTCQVKEKYNVNVLSFYLNLLDEKSIEKLFVEIKEKCGKINYLINNAAISLDSYLFDKTKIEFMQVLEVNVVGTFLMMKYFDVIVDGFIINISSTDGIDTGSIYSIDYNASKAAINSMTKTFSLASSNKIISICPNWVDTISTRSMNQDYLNRELKRIKQDKLINVDVIPQVIDECIKNNVGSGSIIRIDGDEDVREID